MNANQAARKAGFHCALAQALARNKVLVDSIDSLREEIDDLSEQAPEALKLRLNAISGQFLDLAIALDVEGAHPVQVLGDPS